MRILVYYISLIFFAVACNHKTVEKPVWINASSSIQLPDATLQFSTSAKSWNATLQSFSQPIPLLLNYTNTGFTIRLLNKEGVTEGPAQIILSNDSQYFNYDVQLKNKDTNAAKKDYRSPKTVNPDSSLQQQRILHQIDGSRNIISINGNYFNEEKITLSPKAGTNQAIANEPLSAFYVQAGSCVSINIKSSYSKEKEIFTVTAGPLKDKYNNEIADGTLVAFIYNDGERTYRVEATLLHGVATVFIPAYNKNYSLFAKVNETISNTITLKP